MPLTTSVTEWTYTALLHGDLLAFEHHPKREENPYALMWTQAPPKLQLGKGSEKIDLLLLNTIFQIVTSPRPYIKISVAFNRLYARRLKAHA